MRITSTLRHWIAALGLLAAAGFSAMALAQPAGDRPVAAEARIAVVGEITRLSFTLSKSVAARAFVMERPNRVVVELPEVNFQLPPQAGRKGAGLAASFRYGLFAPGRSRIVIDLTRPVRVLRVQSSETSGEVAVLAIELEPVDQARFTEQAQAALAEGRAAASPAPERTGVSPTPQDKRPVIVIDPGHGGIDPGAVTAQVAEKTIVLAFGQRLRDVLERSGRYRVVMTRDGDSFLPLQERVAVARQANADLFVSLHADSLSQAQDVRGATIYTGSERATDAESARLASRENEVDALAGIEAPKDTREDVAEILLDLAKRETRSFSLSFAATLVREMGPVVRLHKIPQRSAGFRVLSAPDVPSVLIELGYVSSNRDVELLTSHAWREQATDAVAKAIDRFFDHRHGPRNRQAGEAGPNARP